jgi:hypothetical protein
MELPEEKMVYGSVSTDKWGNCDKFRNLVKQSNLTMHAVHTIKVSNNFDMMGNTILRKQICSSLMIRLFFGDRLFPNVGGNGQQLNEKRLIEVMAKQSFYSLFSLGIQFSKIFDPGGLSILF